MSKEDASSARGDGTSAGRGVFGRLRGALQRARGHGGPERESLLLILKSTLAATAAWFIAQELLQSEYPAFAPFAAVLMLQVTVYQSVLQSMRFVLAVALGVSLQGLLGFLLTPHIWTFAVVTLVALVIGRWRRLGSQGSQVVTAAFFAYTAFLSVTETPDRLNLLASLILLVLMGSAIGVLVNILIVPPMRYRSAEYGVTNLASAVQGLISDISAALSDGRSREGDSEDWWYRTDDLEKLADQTQHTITGAEESVRWNPRRLLLNEEPPFGGYRTVVDRMRRISAHLSSLVETLRRTSDDPDVPHEDFLRRYGAFLGHIGDAAHLLVELDSARLREQSRQLEDCVEQARSDQSALTRITQEHELNLVDESRVYGGLLLDAERLVEEFDYIHHTLTRVIRHPEDDPEAPHSAESG